MLGYFYGTIKIFNQKIHNFIMKKIAAILSLLLIFAPQAMKASIIDDNADEPNSGVVQGRIVDNEKQPLPGAAIYVEDVKVWTVSEVNGFYTIPDLKPGVHKIKVSYVGYEPYEFTLDVPAGKTLEKDIVMHEGEALEEVKVVGVFSGTSHAMNMQKNAMGISNVVSQEQVGKFPDSNIGDALKRISGINVQYDQGEARFGQVRGTSADLTSVTVNGNRIPSAEGDTRNVQLDLIPADMIQTIEVNKVVSADMDGDAIGGAINLVTKNTPYHRVLSFTTGSGYTVVSGKPQGNLGAVWGDRFFDNKLGIMLAGSYQYAPGGSDNAEFEYELGDDGKVELKEAQVRQYYVTRERQSYSASFDYKFNANHRISFKGIYNRRNDWENRFRLSYKKLNSKASKQSVVLQTKAGSDDNKSARLERQETMDFTLDGNHQFGILKMDWAASFSRASEKRPDERYGAVKWSGAYNNQAWGDNFQDIGKTPYCTLALPAISDDGWEVDELTNSNQNIQENEWKFRLNFKLPLVREGDFSNSLKFGGKYTTKHKNRTTDAYSFDEDVIGDWRSNTVKKIRDGFMVGDHYPEGTSFVSNKYLGKINFDNFMNEAKPLLEDNSDSYHVTEDITAAYIRFDQKLGEKFDLQAGLRLEHTSLSTRGFDYNMDENENESLNPTGTFKHDYNDLLPSLLIRYKLGENGNLRASYTKTISRPKYSALLANRIINIADEDVTLGDPNIKPSRSDNFDFSFDYYFNSIGLVSAGLFYKNVTNVNVEAIGIMSGAQLGLTKYPDVDFDITQNMNAYDARIFGVEVALQRDFSFISEDLDCIGFYGNYTYTHSKTHNYNPVLGIKDGDEVKMAGSPEHTYNASLFFEKWGLDLRLSYNGATSFIDQMNTGSRELDRYYDKVNYLDLNASYTFGRKSKYTFFAHLNNLLNQPLRYYQGNSDRTMQVEYYGIRFEAGLKIDL